MTKKIEPNLSERAMIAKLSIGMWWGVVSDPEARNRFAEDNEADAKFLSLRKKIINPKSLKPISRARSAAMAVHWEMTLPWDNDGGRILSHTGYYKYIDRMKNCQTVYNDAVHGFLPKYDELVDAMGPHLGKLLKKGDYPKSGDELRDKFYMNVDIYPMPSGSDFRSGLIDSKDIESIQAQIEGNVQTRLAEAMQDPWRRLQEKVSHMVERLKSDGTLHESILTNIRELVEFLPVLNILDDPSLMKIAQETLAILPNDINSLRYDGKTRTKTQDAAEKILKKMDNFI